MNYRVEVSSDYDWETKLFFVGNKTDAQQIYDTLVQYYYYDCDTKVSLNEVVDKVPEFKTLDEFLQVHEYKYYYDILDQESTKDTSHNTKQG